MRAPRIGSVGGREAQVSEMVEKARERIPFYRDLHAGVESTRLEDLPTCTKRDLDPYGFFPLSGAGPEAAYHICATSGTSGPRLFVGFDRRDWDRVGKQLGRRAATVGFGAGDLLLNTHGYGLWVGGPTLDMLAHESGAGLIPCGPGGTDLMLAWLAEMPITGLSATPSFLRFLLEAADRAGVDPASWGLRVAFVGGECASASLRRQVSEALGEQFTWQELYGSTETGGPVLGFSPPDDPFCGHLLIDTDEFIVEILYPETDEPVPSGEVGELTVTTPFPRLSPLIRYRTRDLAAEVVDSGPGFPRVTTLLGRLDDGLKVRGALIYPSVIEEVVVPQLARGAEFRIEIDRPQGKMDELTVRVEHEGDPGLVDRLKEDIESVIRLRTSVVAVPFGTLERFSGKAKRVLDHRREDG